MLVNIKNYCVISMEIIRVNTEIVKTDNFNQNGVNLYIIQMNHCEPQNFMILYLKVIVIIPM